MSLCPSCNAEAGDVARFCPSCGAAIVRAHVEGDLVGRIIAGKFRVEAKIGEGGMGKVFRATQLSLDKKVVLKVLHQSLLSDARTVARFQREAKAASRLNHPNSIGVIDFGQAEDGSLYIAMEHVNGQDLHQILSRDGPFPEARLIRVVSQVLSALADAHAAAVIHRDLKPENIMVEQRRGEPDFVKVLDFGIAKLQESGGDEGQALTRAGFVCGTPEYMSPEQARGSQLDARSDLYSVGVILYQCATGSLPFEAESAVGFATKHLTVDPQPPRQKNPHAQISEGMERLILRALSKDPRARPQSAEEFRAELLALAEHERHSARAEVAEHERHVARADSGEAATQVGSEPSGWSDEPTLVSDPPTPLPEPEAPVRRGALRSPIAVFLTGLIGTAALAVGGIVVWDRVVRPRPPEILLELPPRPEQAQAPAAPAAGTPSEPVRSKPMLAKGDAAVAGSRLDEALEQYGLAQQSEPTAASSGRLALVHLLKGDAEAAQKWLQVYREQARGGPVAPYLERHLGNR